MSRAGLCHEKAVLSVPPIESFSRKKLKQRYAAKEETKGEKNRRSKFTTLARSDRGFVQSRSHS